MHYTLLGSTKFKDEFKDIEVKLTLQGHAVYTCAIFGHHTGLDMNSETKRILDEVHFVKIDNSDAVFIINPGGYVGLSTCNEIHYSIMKGKEIHWLEEPSNWKEEYSKILECL